MLRVNKLTKVYEMGDDRSYALRDVNLHIARGEFVAVTGSSGSGKTSLLHMISGIDDPTEGEVFVNSVNITQLNMSERAVFRRRNIGIIYQTYNLVSTLTVEENIMLPMLLDSKHPDKKEITNLLRLLNLEKCAQKLPNQLSGGEQQRTAIGRALLAKPPLVLADEPTGSLDSRNTQEIISLLCKANSELGQTIVIVTHDKAVAECASRRIIMKDGVCFEGDQNEITQASVASI